MDEFSNSLNEMNEDQAIEMLENSYREVGSNQSVHNFDQFLEYRESSGSQNQEQELSVGSVESNEMFCDDESKSEENNEEMKIEGDVGSDFSRDSNEEAEE